MSFSMYPLGSEDAEGILSPRKASLMKSSHLSSAVGTRSGWPQNSAVRSRSKSGLIAICSPPQRGLASTSRMRRSKNWWV